MIVVGLRFGFTHEIITSARHVITTHKITAGTTGTVLIGFPKLPLRPGEYPVYCRISDLRGAHTHYYVVDGLTPSIIIWDDKNTTGLDFELYGSTGYFPLPSWMVEESRADQGKI